MNTYRNSVTAILRAERKSYFLALALGLLFAWHGMARADEYVPPQAAQLPDTVQGRPGAERIPPGLTCTDAMDFSPEDNTPSPFQADSVAYRAARAKAFAGFRVSSDGGCQDFSGKIDKV